MFSFTIVGPQSAPFLRLPPPFYFFDRCLLCLCPLSWSLSLASLTLDSSGTWYWYGFGIILGLFCLALVINFCLFLLVSQTHKLHDIVVSFQGIFWLELVYLGFFTVVFSYRGCLSCFFSHIFVLVLGGATGRSQQNIHLVNGVWCATFLGLMKYWAGFESLVSPSCMVIICISVLSLIWVFPLGCHRSLLYHLVSWFVSSILPMWLASGDCWCVFLPLISQGLCLDCLRARSTLCIRLLASMLRAFLFV